MLVGVMTLAILAFIIIFFVYISEKSPIYFNNAPFVTDKDTYYQGENVTFPIIRCNSASATTTLTSTQSVVSTDGIFTQNIISVTVKAPPGCYTIKAIPKPLPMDLPPNQYKIIFTDAVKGKHRDFVFDVETLPFTVLATSTNFNK